MPRAHSRPLLVLPVAVFFLILVLGCADRGPRKHPNVALILIDTLRADHLGSYGFPSPISPHLDAFASESISFDGCIAPAPWTKPSVASLFTSVPPEIHGVIHVQWPPDPRTIVESDVLPADAVTLAEMFKNAGYHTGAFISNDWLKDPFGYSQGFDTFRFDQRSFHEPRRIVDLVDNWISSQTVSAPYFLYIHLMNAHGPYEFDEKDFQEMKIQLGAARDGSMTKGELSHLYEYSLSTWHGHPEMASSLLNWRAAYAAAVKRADQIVGDLLGKFRDRGAMENTLFIIVSDHGEGLMDHGVLEHGDSFNIEALRVPLMIRLPGGKNGGRRVSGAMSLMDIVPTLADLCGLSGPRNTWSGRSFQAALSGGRLRSRMIFSSASEHLPQQESVIDGRYHLIFDLQSRRVHLFDLEADPKEMRDISREERAVTRRMLAALEKRSDALASAPPLTKRRQVMTREQKEALKSLGYLQ